LFDAEGKLKSFAAGESGLDLLASAIDRTLQAASGAQPKSAKQSLRKVNRGALLPTRKNV
jgi:soluble cytochrome b562